MKPEPSIRYTWCGAAEGACATGVGRGSETSGSAMSSTGFLLSDVALFRYPLRAARRGACGRPGRRGRCAGGGWLHRAVDKETGAIGAFDLPVVSEVEKHPGMAERATAAIAG